MNITIAEDKGESLLPNSVKNQNILPWIQVTALELANFVLHFINKPGAHISQSLNVQHLSSSPWEKTDKFM